MEWFNIIESLVELLNGNELQHIDVTIIPSLFIWSLIQKFITDFNIMNIDAICSHGHTALHQPNEGLTYQIGNLPLLSKLLKRKVVCDFRVQDVEFGGQGAPLVPIGDQILFSDYDFCLNLGGFANISSEVQKSRIAYDICPVNSVLNYYVRQLGFDYDSEGNIASQGSIHQELLDQLNALDFYFQPFPKSLGIEWVNRIVIPLIDSYKLNTEAILRTFVEHIAVQITNELNVKENATVLVTGGGVFNQYLMDRICVQNKSKIVIPEKELVDYKEALIFGLLGVLKLRGEANCLRSVTGASRDHSTGKIFTFNT